MFIKLTDRYNNEFYLQVENIVCIEIILGGSKIFAINGQEYFSQENPEEIIELIDNKRNGI